MNTNRDLFLFLQIGAYFGYSLCVLDINGDGLDDIVVGSPM